ncbi:hypothetical protein B0H11DRAFT_2217247 [Mycena galericulata]|nr:hypothetical protein B0H11DRAFT_2217247 [Mycena galericulata]
MRSTFAPAKPSTRTARHPPPPAAPSSSPPPASSNQSDSSNHSPRPHKHKHKHHPLRYRPQKGTRAKRTCTRWGRSSPATRTSKKSAPSTPSKAKAKVKRAQPPAPAPRPSQNPHNSRNSAAPRGGRPPAPPSALRTPTSTKRNENTFLRTPHSRQRHPPARIRTPRAGAGVPGQRWDTRGEAEPTNPRTHARTHAHTDTTTDTGTDTGPTTDDGRARHATRLGADRAALPLSLRGRGKKIKRRRQKAAYPPWSVRWTPRERLTPRDAPSHAHSSQASSAFACDARARSRPRLVLVLVLVRHPQTAAPASASASAPAPASASASAPASASEAEAEAEAATTTITTATPTPTNPQRQRHLRPVPVPVPGAALPPSDPHPHLRKERRCRAGCRPPPHQRTRTPDAAPRTSASRQERDANETRTTRAKNNRWSPARTPHHLPTTRTPDAAPRPPRTPNASAAATPPRQETTNATPTSAKNERLPPTTSAPPPHPHPATARQTRVTCDVRGSNVNPAVSPPHHHKRRRQNDAGQAAALSVKLRRLRDGNVRRATCDVNPAPQTPTPQRRLRKRRQDRTGTVGAPGYAYPRHSPPRQQAPYLSVKRRPVCQARVRWQRAALGNAVQRRRPAPPPSCRRPAHPRGAAVAANDVGNPKPKRETRYAKDGKEIGRNWELEMIT